MKTRHIELFEKWSANFNRTLQGAYAKSKETNKGFGRAAENIMDYANRSISREEFLVKQNNGWEYKITFTPEVILQPIKFIEGIGNFNFPVICQKLWPSRDQNGRPSKFGYNNGAMYLTPAGEDRGLQVRFLDRKNIEDFFSMFIQSILSSPEAGTPSEPGRFGWKEGGDSPEIQNLTLEKQRILDLIQNDILRRDMRQFTM
jgi:hypothetical protein